MSRCDTGPAAPAVAAKARDTDWLSALVPVYDGRHQCIGHLRHRGRDAVEAYDMNTVSVGLYDTLEAAATALWRFAHNQMPRL